MQQTHMSEVIQSVFDAAVANEDIVRRMERIRKIVEAEVAAEREACRRIVQGMKDHPPPIAADDPAELQIGWETACDNFLEAIAARGDSP